MSDISIIGGYRITNQFPCFLRPIYQKNEKYYIQIEDEYGKLSNYEEIDEDLSKEGSHIILLNNQINKIDSKVDYGFAFDECDIIIDPLDIFCIKLNMRRKEMPPVINDILNEYLKKRRLQHQRDRRQQKKNLIKRNAYAIPSKPLAASRNNLKKNKNNHTLKHGTQKTVPLYTLKPAAVYADSPYIYAKDTAELSKNLTEREAAVMDMRYGQKPLTQREVAESLGISRSYVAKIEQNALKKTSRLLAKYSKD
ncbi:MAG: sigma factor-like helix-turn-helix DNA-binding protein [Oscillospiraceae bacterium]